MNYNEIIKRLHEPFGAKEIEWKIQVTTQDKKRGMAVAYMDARAVQKRLDEVVGAFSWKNVYSLWHDNSQICGISIFNDDRSEWITKFDGAENSDIEPKGKSFAIKQNQYSKLESEYNNAVNRIFSLKPTQQNVQQTAAPKEIAETTAPANEYKVQSIKPSGKSSQVLELIDNNGETVKAYIKAADQSIKVGAKLNNVRIETKNSNYGDYNLISNYKLAA